MRELEQVNQDIKVAKGQIAKYPAALQEKKKELAKSTNQSRHQQRTINKIPGSDEEDLQLIADVDQIRLHEVHAIGKALQENN